MDLKIRKAEPTDADELAQVVRETFALAGPPGADIAQMALYIEEHLGPKSLLRLINQAECFVGCALVGNEIVGFVVLEHDRGCPADDTLKDTAEVQRLYVREKYHGTGVALDLLQTALQVAVERGARHAWLGVFSGNGRAIRFYNKMGFVEVGLTHFQMGNEVHLDSIMVAEIG